MKSKFRGRGQIEEIALLPEIYKKKHVSNRASNPAKYFDPGID